MSYLCYKFRLHGKYVMNIIANSYQFLTLSCCAIISFILLGSFLRLSVNGGLIFKGQILVNNIKQPVTSVSHTVDLLWKYLSSSSVVPGKTIYPCAVSKPLHGLQNPTAGCCHSLETVLNSPAHVALLQFWCVNSFTPYTHYLQA